MLQLVNSHPMDVHDERYRCDVCGRFISMDDFHSGTAVRHIVTVDAYYSQEGYETLCKHHAGLHHTMATEDV
jgi:hypothetical protein